MTIAVTGMYLYIAIGSSVLVEFRKAFGILPKGLWIVVLLIYAWMATGLPCLVMPVITNWAMVKNEVEFLTEPKCAE